MGDYTDAIEQVRSAFIDDDIEIEDEQVRERLVTLNEEYSVPLKEARRSVIRKIGEEHGLDPLGNNDGPGGDTSDVSVSEITRAGNWVSVEVQMVDAWDQSHPSIGQTGLVADNTGTIKFTSWDDANQPMLEEGQSYRLENVVTDEYQGNMSIQLQESSSVEQLDREVEAGEETTSTEGVLVDVNNGSGLIKRCPEDDCSRVVQNDRCSEHGPVEGEWDLRIKAVFDDGHDTQSVIFNREATTELTGWTLDEAKEEAQAQLDTEVVIESMLPEIVNRYYTIEGPQYGEYLMAEECEQLGAPEDGQAESLLEAL